MCSDTNRGARPLPGCGSRPTALSLTVRRGFCKAREEEEEEVSGKLELGASSLPRNHHQRQSDGRREREETCGETRKGFSAAVRTKKTVEPPRALLSPPSPSFLTAQRCTFGSAASLHFAIHLEEAKVKDLPSLRGSSLSAAVMSGHERGFHILHS